MEKTLVLDPSGNHGDKEGYGSTGWALFEGGGLVDFGSIFAGDFKSQEEYWQKISHLIGPYVKVNRVLCESYKLQPSKANAQSYSNLFTPQLIGFLRMFCFENSIEWVFCDPKDKVRVADEQLIKMGYIQKQGNRYTCNGQPTNLHMRDAIRHGIYYFRYRHKKV